MKDAYLDIETTGLSWTSDRITVVGVYLVDSARTDLVQLVGNAVSAEALSAALTDVGSIYTYNGSRFDLPFINAALGIDLESTYGHCDLMLDCWQCNLYGGFKAVEAQLGISRRIKDVGGWEAVLLWRRYQHHGDKAALDKLLEYNKEDVVNLKVLRDRLSTRQRAKPSHRSHSRS